MRWIAGVLLSLLALSYALIVLATPGTKVRPAPDDRGWGGLSLLTRALRDAGYRVAFDGSTRPNLAKDDVAIVPVLDNRTVPDEALAHIRAGGRALVLEVPGDLPTPSESIQVVDFSGRTGKIDNVGDGNIGELSPLPPVSVWNYDGTPISTLGQIGKGRVARVVDGALATNRFLGRYDNAKVVLSTLLPVAPKGSQLVFLAGGYGEAEPPGPIEAVGPWALGAVRQCLVLLAAFGIARGIRFGLSVPEMRQKRGARELLDAVAGHYRRGKRTDAPLHAAARERADDASIQALAARKKVPEAEARKALMELESRPKVR